MNREDIIKLAREAGLGTSLLPLEEIECKGGIWMDGDFNYIEVVERFAALVAAAEREACAKVCEDLDFEKVQDAIEFAYVFADAIRARGNT